MVESRKGIARPALMMAFDTLKLQWAFAAVKNGSFVFCREKEIECLRDKMRVWESDVGQGGNTTQNAQQLKHYRECEISNAHSVILWSTCAFAWMQPKHFATSTTFVQDLDDST